MKCVHTTGLEIIMVWIHLIFILSTSSELPDQNQKYHDDHREYIAIDVTTKSTLRGKLSNA